MFINILAQSDSLFLGNVVFIGLHKTNEKYLLRELPVKVGSKIATKNRQADLELNRQTLYNLRLFTRVNAQDSIFADTLIQVFDFQERWYYTPRAHVELQERTLNDLIAQPSLYRATLTTGLFWQNVAGHNETIEAFAKLGYTTGALIRFNKPYLWPIKPWDVSLEIEAYQQHEVLFADKNDHPTYLRVDNFPILKLFNVEVALARRFNPRKSFTYVAGINGYFIADTLKTVKPEFVLQDKSSIYPYIAVKYWHDTRDQRTFPLTGFKVQGSIQANYWPKVISNIKIEAQLSKHYPITHRWNIAAGAYAYSCIGSNMPYYERFFWGQKQYFIRGYEQYLIEGQALLGFKSELKYGIIPRKMVHFRILPKKFQDWPLAFYLSAFGDVGYSYHQTLASRLHNSLLPGVGIGANFLFLYDTFFRVEISRNRFSETSIVLNFLLAIR